MSAAELIAELTESFQSEPYPGELNIVYTNSDYDLEVKQIRETFKVHTWQELPDELMLYEQFGISFLSKKGLRYYLPAFLQFAVRDYAGSDSIPPNLVFKLTLPAEADVVLSAFNASQYQFGTDTSAVSQIEYYQARLRDANENVHRFIDHYSQFSAAQSRAILHFLEYMRDEYGGDFCDGEPETAIERYWFQFAQTQTSSENPAHHLAATHQIIPVTDHSELIKEITSAFENEPYPGDLDIVYDNTGFHLECIEIRDAFKGHAWRAVPDDILSTERTGLSFMSKQGFQYYLPAFMCSLLRDSSIVGDGISMVVLMLKLPTEIDSAVVAEKIQRFEQAGKLPDVDLNEVLQNQLLHTNSAVNAFIARASLFTKAQGQAIHHFLIYARDKFNDDFLSTEADLAIQRYWFQFA